MFHPRIKIKNNKTTNPAILNVFDLFSPKYDFFMDL